MGTVRRTRRIIARQYAKEVAKIADEEAHMFKRKPGWMPMRLWIFGLGVFVKIKRNKK